MLRLRTTVVMSVLGLAVGVAGTHWLSARSTDEPLAMQLAIARQPASPRQRAIAAAAHAVAHTDALLSRRSLKNKTASATRFEPSHVDAAPAAPELVPLDMPATRDLAYEQLRGHLDGYVVMRVSIDSRGHVTSAGVAQTSGDPVLDTHALRSVRGWRFAVPADHPEGLSADLPMRFSSHDGPVASLP